MNALKTVVVDFNTNMELYERQERVRLAKPYEVATQLFVGEIHLGNYENDQDLMAATHAIVTTRAAHQC